MPAPKPAILAVVAAASVGVAAWSVMGSTASRTPLAAPRSSVNAETASLDRPSRDAAARADPAATPPRTAEAAAEPAPNFPAIAGPADIEQSLSALAQRAGDESRSVPELAAMGAAASGGFADSAAKALAPFLHGSREKMIETVRALGGTPPEVAANSGKAPPNNPLFALLKNASLDYSRARVIPKMVNGQARADDDDVMAAMNDGAARTASGKAIPGTMSAEAAERAASSGGARREARTVMKMMTGAMYPDVQDPASKKLSVFEVRVPVLMEGADPKATKAEIGVELAYEPSKRLWQPVGVNVYNLDAAQAMKLARAAQEARDAREAEQPSDPSKAVK